MSNVLMRFTAPGTSAYRADNARYDLPYILQVILSFVGIDNHIEIIIKVTNNISH